MRGRSGPSGRQRGISLLEGILYLTLAASVIGFSATFLLEEQRRQEEIMAAREIEMALEASQRFIASRSDEILTEMTGLADNRAERSYTLENLAALGFLPAQFAAGEGALNRVFGHELRLLVRAVLVRSGPDPDPDQVRMTLSGDEIVPTLLDGDPLNDEARIEAVLFSDGPTRIPTQRAARITVRTERSNVGFITPPPPGAEPPPSEPVPNAIGPYGAFSFNVSGFSDLPVDRFGRFAAIVALPDAGVLNDEGGGEDESDLRGFLKRCQDVPGGTPLYEQCLSASNELFTDIIFTSDTDNDGAADTVRRIIGQTLIQMGDPVDADGDGAWDLARIENLQAIGCGPVPPGASIPDEFRIECDLTRTAGDLAADGSITADGAITGGSVRVGTGADPKTVISSASINGGDEILVAADRILMRAPGSGSDLVTDLQTGVYDVNIAQPGELIDKPTCPAKTLDGNDMEPRIYVAPAAYANPDGYPAVGARAFAQDVDAGTWRVRLIQYIAQDRCDLTFPESLPDNAPPDACGMSTSPSDDPSLWNPDGKSDAYEVLPEFGRVLVITRCF